MPTLCDICLFPSQDYMKSGDGDDDIKKLVFGEPDIMEASRKGAKQHISCFLLQVAYA